MTIANFGHDVNWKYSGGKAGDQTGGTFRRSDIGMQIAKIHSQT